MIYTFYPFVRGNHWSQHKQPLMRSFDIFLAVSLNRRLSKQSSWVLWDTIMLMWHYCNKEQSIENLIAGDRTY